MMNSEIRVSENLKYKIIIAVNKDLKMDLEVEQGEDPSLLDIQKVLLYMCLQIGSQLNEE